MFLYVSIVYILHMHHIYAYVDLKHV